MRLPSGYGSVIKLKGNRRRPYQARITIRSYRYRKNHIYYIRLFPNPKRSIISIRRIK